jgi:DNA-binding response OmpR family regulator
LIITIDKEASREVQWELTRSGFTCSVTVDDDEIIDQVEAHNPKLVLIKANTGSQINLLSKRLKRDRILSIIALLPAEFLKEPDHDLNVDDFLIEPYHAEEVILRIRRLLSDKRQHDHLITCGDLVIDTSRYEVSIAGKSVTLTFKEYELLKYLASDPGRVFTREILLDSIWGYDYYGGDRTVDVTIRRLRSKIEDSTRSYIETVRNIGYKFRDNS